MFFEYLGYYARSNAALIVLLIGMLIASFSMKSDFTFGIGTMRLMLLNIFMLSVCIFHYQYTYLFSYENGTRTLMTVLYFSLWPTLLYGFSLMIPWQYPRRLDLFLWIPALINIVIFGSCFVTGSTFYFDGQNNLIFDPFAYLFYAICLFYLVVIVVRLVMMIPFSAGPESAMLLFCCGSGVVCAVLNIFFQLRINLCLIAAVYLILFNWYLYFQPARRDMLTGVFNRQMWESDCVRYNAQISGMALLKLDGLRETNRKNGIESGNLQLENFANVVTDCLRTGMRVYRIGSGKFCVLYLNGRSKGLKNFATDIKDSLIPAELSCKIGTAVRDEGETIPVLMQKAEDAMETRSDS